MSDSYATIGVLDDDPEVGQVLWKAGGGSGRLHRQWEAIPQLFHLAELAGVYQLWVSDRWFARRPNREYEKAWHLAPVDDARGQLALVFPSLDQRLALFASLTGETLLETLVTLERELGTWFTATPGRTAEALIRADLRRRGLHNVAELPPFLTANRKPVEAPFAWIRPLTPEEAAMPYLVAVDKHAAYLTAMGHLELGTGGLEHRLRRDAPASFGFDRKLPGYWHARTFAVAWDLPDPTRARGRPGRREWAEEWRWLTTPSVRAAAELGILQEINEAWVWRQHTRPLAPFADRLRLARLHTRGAAAAVVKRLYASMIGRLRMTRQSGPDPLYRPDWHDHLVAEARVNLFFNARAVSAETDLAPAAAAIDCWYFPMPTREPPAGLHYGDAAGQYSVKGIVPMSAVRDVFNTPHVRVLADRVAQLAAGPCRFCASPGSEDGCCIGMKR